MHHNTTLAETTTVDAVLGEIVGYVGLLFFAGIGALMVALRWRTSTNPASMGHLWLRAQAYALVLACLYPVVALNRFALERPDGALVPVGAVALNALVWIVALGEVVAWFIGYDGAPEHWNVYDTLVGAVRVLVLALAGAGLASENARFVALVLVLPLAGALAWAATTEATERRSVLRPPALVLTRPRAVLGTLGAIGLLSLSFEVLGPSYGGAVGPGVAAVLMLVEHAALVPLFLLMARAPAAEPPPRRESPPPARPASPVVETVVIPTEPPSLIDTMPPGATGVWGEERAWDGEY